MTFSQAGQYFTEALTPPLLLPLESVPFAVYNFGTNILANLYTDHTKSHAAPNPTETSTIGNMLFYADPGPVDVQCNGLRQTVVINPFPSDLVSSEDLSAAIAANTSGMDLFVFPSGDVTGAVDTATINAAVSALGTLPTGGTVHLGTSLAHPDWHVTTPAGINSIGVDMTLGGTVRNVSIAGGGSACTTVYTVGTGMHFFNHPSAADQSKDKGVSVIEKLAIDNSLNTNVGAVGVDWGDFQGAAPDDLLIRNFSNGLNSTTIATQVDVSTLTGTQSVNVASTSTLASSGVVRALITEGARVCVRTIRYTAKDATHLLNCTCIGAPSGSLALAAAPVWQASVGATTITSPIADLTTLTGSGTVTVASTAALVAPGWIMTDTSAGVVAIAFTTIASGTTLTGAKVSSIVAAGTSVAVGASAWQTTGVDCALRLRAIASVPTEKFKPSNMVLVNNAVHVKFLPVTGNYSFDYQNWDGVEIRNVADFQMGFSIEGASLAVGDTWTSIIGNNLAHYNTLFNVQDSATVYDAQFNGCANEKTGTSGSNVMTFNVVATSPNAAVSPTFSWNGGSRMLMIGSTSYLGGASGLAASWVSGVTQHISGAGSQTLDCCGAADNGHGGLQGPLDAFFCRMTGDMSTTITNPSGGQLVTLIINQDGTGGHVFTPPANWTGGVFPQDLAANSLCSATAIYNAVSAKFVQVASSGGNSGGGVLTPTPNVKAAQYSANPSDWVPCNVSGGSFPVDLPDAPPDGTMVLVEVVAGGNGANHVVVTAHGTDVFNVSGGVQTQTLSLQNQAIVVQYKASTRIWYATYSQPISSLDLRYDALGSATAAQAAAQAASDPVGAAAAALATAESFTTSAVASVAARVISQSFFGSGSDGPIVFDGTSTITLAGGLTIVPAAGVYTLNRDVHATTLVVNAGVIVKTALYRIYGTVSIVNNGTIDCSGLGASGATGGAGQPTSTLGSTLAGSTAGLGAGVAGSAGANQTCGGAGGGSGGSGVTGDATAGGTGPNGNGYVGQVGGTAGGAGTGGSAGAIGGNTTVSVNRSTIGNVLGVLLGIAEGNVNVVPLGGGAPGAAGAGDGTSPGGGGGAPGGTVFLAAPTVTNNGVIDANGGPGGNVSAGNAGGGGGGGGGFIQITGFVITRGTLSVSGGIAGLGLGHGKNGGAGGTGFTQTSTLS